jgi:hypothetical protein
MAPTAIQIDTTESEPLPSGSETRVRCVFQPAPRGALPQISLLIMCIELHFEP